MPKFLVLSRIEDYTFQNRVSNSVAGQSLFRSLAINQHHHSIESNPLVAQTSICKRFIIASSNIKPNFTFVAFAKQDIDYPVENKGGGTIQTSYRNFRLRHFASGQTARYNLQSNSIEQHLIIDSFGSHSFATTTAPS